MHSKLSKFVTNMILIQQRPTWRDCVLHQVWLFRVVENATLSVFHKHLINFINKAEIEFMK